ncbi:MAG TPA: hypothetical protein VMY39_10710 [Planctomycetota bacterium]|nr:hypothetical protein [Planctomycetota bacterium]
MDTAFWLNIGIGGAVVIVVRLFLNHLRRERRACENCRSEHHAVTQEFGRIVSNHLQHESETLERLCGAVRSLETVIREHLEPTESEGTRRR